MILEEEHYSKLQKFFDKIEADPELLQSIHAVCQKEVLAVDEIMKLAKSQGCEFYDYEDIAVSDMTCRFATMSTKTQE